jgi:hypothetical protein
VGGLSARVFFACHKAATPDTLATPEKCSLHVVLDLR